MRGTTSGLSIFLLLDIGLADDDQRSALRDRKGFHGGQRDRLMLGQVASLSVARGSDHSSETKIARRPRRPSERSLPCSTCFLLSR